MLILIVLSVIIALTVSFINWKSFIIIKQYFKKSEDRFFGMRFKSAHYVKAISFFVVFTGLAVLIRFAYDEVGYILASFVTVLAPLLYRSVILLKLSSVLKTAPDAGEKKFFLIRLLDILPDLVLISLSVSVMMDYIFARLKPNTHSLSSDMALTAISSCSLLILLLLYVLTIAKTIIIEDELQLKIRKKR